MELYCYRKKQLKNKLFISVIKIINYKIMNIETKTITDSRTISSTFTLTTLSDIHMTSDDPFRKILRVTLAEATPPQQVIITGADYDSLGQWTDSSLNSFLVNKYGLTVVNS